MHWLDFPLWLRALHFCNLVFVTLLIRSGLEILSAHPKLYWNDSCTPGSEWLKLGKGFSGGRRIPVTPHFGRAAVVTGTSAGAKPALGVVSAVLLSALYMLLLMFVVPRHYAEPARLWTSRDEEVPFPSWLALPGNSNLGMGRHWHFLCDAGWLITGITYYTLLFATGEWRRLVPTSWSVIPGAWQVFLHYASFHLVETPGAYNPLQQLAYFSIVFIVAPLAIATGVAMSPSITARFPRYLRIFHGRQSARSIHFLCMLAFVGFLIMHVLMVVLHGFGRELALIVFGQTSRPNIQEALLIGWAGIFGVLFFHVIATEASLKYPRWVADKIGVIIDGARRVLFGHSISRQNYSVGEISPYFRVNGRPPVSSLYNSLVEAGFANYRLDVGGLLDRPLQLSLADLKSMPHTTQVTQHCCIQGWSGVAEWGGVELKRIIKLVRPQPSVRYIALYAFDDKSETEPYPDAGGYFYGTIHIDLARDPQTILAYEMNGEPLPIPHGAPLRLRVETQLGFMMVKYIQRIEFIEDYRNLGLGQGGWREDHQFYSLDAGI